MHLCVQKRHCTAVILHLWIHKYAFKYGHICYIYCSPQKQDRQDEFLCTDPRRFSACHGSVALEKRWVSVPRCHAYITSNQRGSRWLQHEYLACDWMLFYGVSADNISQRLASVSVDFFFCEACKWAQWLLESRCVDTNGHQQSGIDCKETAALQHCLRWNNAPIPNRTQNKPFNRFM